jgi:osmotically-inducible protein OsmY
MKTLAILALLALVGCSRNDKTATVEPVGTTTVTSAPATMGEVSEQQLDRPETSIVLSQPSFSTSDVDRAINQINMTRVTEVMEPLNDLARNPLSPAPEGDERTTFHVQMALLRSEEVVDRAGDIDVKVDHGAVTLEGVTSTPAARTAAERVALQQPDVTTVDNRLRVGPVPPPRGHAR